MGVGLRRLLYLTAFLLFVVFGVAVTLYAAGYRYNQQTRTVSKVGAFYIKSYPAGSRILLDGKDTAAKTPARLLNVHPGVHTVTVMRGGFVPWEKSLIVEAGQTTFIRDIVLFRENPSATLLGAGGTRVIVAQETNAYAFIDQQGNIHLTNMDTQRDFIIETSHRPEKLLAFSKDNGLLLFESESQLFLTNVNTEESKRLGPSRPVRKATWDRNDSTVVWLLVGRNVEVMNLVTSEQQRRISAVDDFTLGDRNLMTLTRGNNATVLREHSLDGATILSERILPTDDVLTFYESRNENIMMRGEKRIWIVDQDESRSFDASDVAIHDESLLIASNFEILLYHLRTKKLELVDRTSTPVEKLQWHPNGSYFLRSQSSQLQLIELDSRDRRNMVTLSFVSGAYESIFSKKGDLLFMVTPQTNQVLSIQ